MSKTTGNIIKISAVCVAIVAIVAAFVFNSNDQKQVSTTKNNTQNQSQKKTDNKDSKQTESTATTGDDQQQTVVAGSQATANAPADTNYTPQTGSLIFPKSNPVVTVASSSNSNNNNSGSTNNGGSTNTGSNGSTGSNGGTSTGGNGSTGTGSNNGGTTGGNTGTGTGSTGNNGGTTGGNTGTGTGTGTGNNGGGTTTPTNPANNLIANGDVEASDGTNPTGWSFAVDNAQTSATSAYAVEGTNHYLRTSVTAVGGTYPGAQWAPATASAVTGGTTYKYTESYRSSVSSEIDVEYTHTVNGVATTEFLTVLDQVAPANNWTTYSGTFDVPADATSVTVYHVLATTGTLDTDNFSLTAFTPTPVGNGMVSLTFDDGWNSIYTNAFPILKNLNLPNTQYLISNELVRADHDAEYMTTANAAQFLTIPGSEIGSHTVHHCDLTGVQTDDATNCPLNISEAQIQSELNDSKTALQNLFGINVTDFASPYGATNPAVVTDIKNAGYQSHRSVAAGYNVGGGFNPYNIKVQNICGVAVAGVCDHATTAADVQSWLQYAHDNKVWLVIVFHEVTDTPSDPSYAVTTSVFTQMMNEVVSFQAQGLAVKSMSDALAAMPAN